MELLITPPAGEAFKARVSFWGTYELRAIIYCKMLLFTIIYKLFTRICYNVL